MNIRVKKFISKSNDSFFSKVKYLLLFIAKSFLYAMGVIFFLIIVMALIYIVDMAYNKKENNNKPPLFAAFIIVSPSMIPNINVNDAVVIFRSDPNNLEVGDIITFSSNDPNYSGLTVTHRIIGKELTDSGKYVFRTKGDNNNSEDPSLVEESKVFGKVFFRIPKLGYIRHFLTTSYGFLILIVLPVTAVIIYDIIKLIKKLKQYYLINSDLDVLEDLGDDSLNDSEQAKVIESNPIDYVDVLDEECSKDDVLIVEDDKMVDDVDLFVPVHESTKDNGNDEEIEIL